MLTLLDGSAPHTSEVWKKGEGLSITYDEFGVPILTATGAGGGEPTAGYVEVADDDTSPVLVTRMTFQGAVVAVDPLTDYATFSFDGRYRRAGVTIPWSDIGSRPTDLAGYGIANAYTMTQLQTSGQAQVDAGNLIGTISDLRLSANVALRGFNQFSSYQEVQRASAANAAFAGRITGESSIRWQVNVDGTQWWGHGTGGATPLDTNLYRYAANVLRTDDGFAAESFLVGVTPVITTGRVLTNVTADAAIITSGTFGDVRLSNNIPRLNITNEFTNWLSVRRSLATEAGVGVWITGDTTFRWRVLAGGEVQWGTGTGAVYDTNLYRSAANTLRTDDYFSAFSFQIAGSTVINSSSQLVNVTADAAIITSGTFNIDRIPSGISRVGHTHDMSDVFGELGVAKGGTGRQTVTSGAVLIGNPAGNTQPLQEVLPGASGGFLVSWNGAWTRQSGVQWADISNPPVYATRWPTLTEIGAAATAHTHAAQDITSGNFNVRLGWESPFTRGSASAIMAVGYNIAASGFNNTALPGALVLTTAFGSGLGNNMFTIKIVGRIHTSATNIELLISGYQTSVGGIANASITSNHRDFNYPVRLGFNAAGFLCVIIGGTSDTWSYPRLYVPYASIGYSAGSARGAQFEGWDFTAVTDLTGYTTLTPLTDESNAQYLNAQPASYYLDAGNLTGNLADARLSANIPRKNENINQDFIGKIRSIRSTGTWISFEAAITGDTNGRWSVRPDGRMYWGAGGASAYDTSANLYRAGVDYLATDGYFSAFTLRVAGTDVINSSRQLVNVTANASILNSGLLDINLIPSGISRVGHTHDMSDVFGELGVPKGGTGRQTVATGAVLIGNPAGNTQPLQEVLPGADGGFLVSWSGAWTRQSGVQWADISAPSRPTTLAGYGITDAAPLTHGHEELAQVAQYTYGAATAPRLFPHGFVHSFVRSADGWPMDFGKLLHFGSYTSSQDGAAFQILTPYALGSGYNNGKPMYRSGVYSNAGWSVWQTFASESWVSANYQAQNTYLNRLTEAPVNGNASQAYGALRLTGQNASYSGIQFGDMSTTLMVYKSADNSIFRQGFYRYLSPVGWQWYFENGVLVQGEIPVGRITGVLPAAQLPTVHSARHTFNGGIRFPDGTGAAPSVAIGQDDLGFWRYTTNGLGLAGILYITRNLAVDWDIVARANSAHPAAIGNHATYPGYAAFWRNGNAHYAVLADANHLLLNANSVTGGIYIRQANANIATFDGSGLSLTGSFSATGEVQARSAGSPHPQVTMGVHPSYPGNGALWRGSDAHYSILMNGTHTYINATSTTGNIYFRAANAEKFWIDNSGTYPVLRMVMGAMIASKNAATGVDEAVLYPRWTDNKTYFNYGSAGLVVRDNASVIKMTIDATGVSFIPNVTVSGYVTASTFYTSSSRQFKTDIRELGVSALGLIRDTRILRFRYRDNPVEQQIGFMAEEAPELFVTRDRLRMKPNSVLSVALAGIQELESRVASLENENARLRAQLARMN